MEVKPQDLRVGNLIRYKDLPELRPDRRGITVAVTADDILALSQGYNDIVEFVPITEESLVRFGFWVDEDGFSCIDIYHRTYLRMFPVDGGYQVIVRYRYEGQKESEQAVNTMNVMKYEHQIQNFYFALSGYELEENGI